MGTTQDEIYLHHAQILEPLKCKKTPTFETPESIVVNLSFSDGLEVGFCDGV